MITLTRFGSSISFGSFIFCIKFIVSSEDIVFNLDVINLISFGVISGSSP